MIETDGFSLIFSFIDHEIRQRKRRDFPKLSDSSQVREEFPARDEGEDKVEESGVHAAADHLHYEGVADRAEDPLLVLHVFDLFVPDHDSHYLDHD